MSRMCPVRIRDYIEFRPPRACGVAIKPCLLFYLPVMFVFYVKRARAHAYMRRPRYNAARILDRGGGGDRRLNQGEPTRVVKMELKNVRQLTSR